MRAGIGLAVVLVATLLVEALAVQTGGAAAIVLFGFVAVLATPFIARMTVDQTALACTYGSALLIPLYGVGGHLRPGDLLLPVAIMLFLASQRDRPWPHLPGWVWALTLGVIVTALLHQFAPTDPTYLGARTVVDAAGNLGPEPETNLGVAPRFLFAVIGIPLAFTFAAQRSAAAPRRIAGAFTVGSAISGLVAVAAASGLSGITAALGSVAIGNRQAGLTGHPDFLGAVTVLSIPFALRMAFSPEPRRRFPGIVLATLITLGVYESGSRGGAGAFAVAVLIYLAIEPRLRRFLAAIALVLAGLVALTFLVLPHLGQQILQATRITGTSTGSAAGSDAVRHLVATQGMRDFSYSPIDGIGLQVAAEAHNVYLQALAAGGVLLFASYAILVLGSIVSGVRLISRDSLAVPTTASLIGGAVFGGFENTLTYRFVYVPIGIVAAIAAQHRLQRRPASDQSWPDDDDDTGWTPPPSPPPVPSRAAEPAFDPPVFAD